MKLEKLQRHLRRYGCHLARQGARHSIWINPANGESTAVPRHREVDDRLVAAICRHLDVPPP
ncbi:MAG: type II toxin-antitoxin system HicA family toxin [Armatimonadetes bacterium]|nr:type II toxin-antitoxin system HicA family toxin [Armatimonadota bacterium]